MLLLTKTTSRVRAASGRVGRRNGLAQVHEQDALLAALGRDRDGVAGELAHLDGVAVAVDERVLRALPVAL